MAYKRINWTNTQETPINAKNLNVMDEGIEQAHNGENIPVFDSYDNAEVHETILEVETIASGDKLGLILSKITKFTSNIRYIIEKLALEKMHEAGYGYVGDAIAELSPQFAYMSLSEATDINRGGIIPFDSYVTKGNAFSVSNGVVTVEEDMEFVRVSATIGGSATSGRCWLRILRNNSTVYDALVYGDYFSPTGSSICKAAKGDTFSVVSNEAVTVKSGGVGCYFNIEKIC